ncbi:anti-sigma factor [Cellulomonas sp. PhB143]|uniref:anti-sigma factor n=1 Tax=Cellulomonas sp. PhB143 TaxID=2485186 RepID=UPI000F4712A7|nr:anti-sigma factor [Cellulomonas sp. PhB143]ROS78885.1 anti-sigma-K factor RskA [Cellulomonas sp. PhB143]
MADRTSGGRGDVRDLRDPGEGWDLLPAYALDAVDDLERRQVERLLDADGEARRALDEFRETVGAFVVDTEPPPGLRAATIAAITGDVPAEAPAPAADQGRPADVVPIERARRRRRWSVVAVAAAAVVAVAIPTTVAVQARQEQSQLQAQSDRVAQMLADPDARLVTSQVTGGGEASALVSGDDVLFTASDLPAASDDQDYQLWIVAGDDITSAGLLDTSDDSSQALVSAAAGEVVAMTLEPAGGSEQPTSDPIVTLQA